MIVSPVTVKDVIAVASDVGEREQGVELFYDFAVTPYLNMTPDIQFIDNGLPGARDSWVIALRAYLRI